MTRIDENGKEVKNCKNCGRIGKKVEYFGTYGYMEHCQECGDIRNYFRDKRAEKERNNRHCGSFTLDYNKGLNWGEVAEKDCENCLEVAKERLMRAGQALEKNPRTSFYKDNYFGY